MLRLIAPVDSALDGEYEEPAPIVSGFEYLQLLELVQYLFDSQANLNGSWGICMHELRRCQHRLQRLIGTQFFH